MGRFVLSKPDRKSARPDLGKGMYTDKEFLRDHVIYSSTCKVQFCPWILRPGPKPTESRKILWALTHFNNWRLHFKY